MPTDTPQLRGHLFACLPSLIIDEVAAESGQRVYYAHFDDSLIPADIPPPDAELDEAGFLHGWGRWGKIVVKVVSGAGADTLARLQAETAIPEEVRPADFPKLLYSNLFTENPVTEVRLAEGLYVTVEEFIESSPLMKFLTDIEVTSQPLLSSRLEWLMQYSPCGSTLKNSSIGT